MRSKVLFLGLCAMLCLVFTGCESDSPSSKGKKGKLTDADGNVYTTIKIGEQEWSVENWKCTKYNDGTPIDLVTSNSEWEYSKTGSMCYYKNNSEYRKRYGVLYNWAAVKTGRMAPEGWRVPTEEDWKKLSNYLIANGYNYDGTIYENRIGQSMAKNDNNEWNSYSEVGTIGDSQYGSKVNSSGFSAIPGGFRFSDGRFADPGYAAAWWSSTSNGDDAGFCALYNHSAALEHGAENRSSGMSIRMVKDPSVSTYTITFDPNGGNGTMAPQTFTKGASTDLRRNTFTRTKYLFTGWNTDRNGSGTHFDDEHTVEVSANVTLYAQWIYLYFDLVKVEGGSFRMGIDDGSAASPSHNVILDDYYICKYEVTITDRYEIMGYPNEDNRPVHVSWNECQNLIQILNNKTGLKFRLPTEAEWEYAAKGGKKSKGYLYSGSNNLDAVAWNDGNSGTSDHTVGQKLPNELGLYDMSGNASEFCSDWYGAYSSNTQTNPTGPSGGSYKVIRGGHFYSDLESCRTTSRSYEYNDSHGFRLVLQIK